MDMNKNLKVAVFDPDLDDSFLFGFEFSKEKITFSYNKEDVTLECMKTFKDFATELHTVFEILYAEYAKDS